MTAAMRSLIVGGSGMDGSLIAQQLVLAGIDVHATSRSFDPSCSVKSWADLDIADLVVGHRLDPADADAVHRLVAELAPDMIFCLAGQSSVGRSFAIPIETLHSHIDPVLHICAAVHALKCDSHIVLAASGEIFGETTHDAPAREDSPPRPQSPYAIGKAIAVSAAKRFRDAFGLRLSIAYLYNHECILRPTDFLFGKVLAGIETIKSGQSDHIELGNGNVARDWGWAPDYANAMIKMAMRSEGGDFVLATGQTCLLRDAVSAVVAASGLDPGSIIRWNSTDHGRPGEARTMAADPGRARTILGWNGSLGFPELAHRLLGTDLSPSCK